MPRPGGSAAIFLHRHPYPPLIPQGATRLIVGTLPPPRFSVGKLRDRDVDFCYGSCDGQLWPVLDRLFSLGLRYDNSAAAVKERLAFLRREGIGICDIVASCRRQRMDAADITMQDIVLRDLVATLRRHHSIAMVLFTGGNSKNGPEYLFRRQLAAHKLVLEPLDGGPPRRHRLHLDGREVVTVSLISPSSAANRAIGAREEYRRRRAEDPSYTPFDFRLAQYRQVFLPG